MNRRERRALLFQEAMASSSFESKGDHRNIDVRMVQEEQIIVETDLVANQAWTKVENQTMVLNDQLNEEMIEPLPAETIHEETASDPLIIKALDPPHVLLNQEKAEEIVKNATFLRTNRNFVGSRGFTVGIGKSIPNAFLRRVKFSTDGSFLATDSADNVIKIFDFDDFQQSIKQEIDVPMGRIPTGGFVQDMKWNPKHPCLAVVTHSSPIRLFSTDGKATMFIVAKNALDEHSTVTALEWISETEILAGFAKGSLRCFDVNRPTKPTIKIGPEDKSIGNPSGKISCLANSNNGYYVAVGDYQGTVSIYAKSHSTFVNSYNFCSEAVIDLRYSVDDDKLFISYQKVSAIYCLDLRNVKEEYALLKRPYESNQRIGFDIDRAGKWLVSGSVSNDIGGEIYFFNLDDLSCEPLRKLVTPSTAVVSTSIHPKQSLLVAGTGERIFPQRLNNFGLSDTSSSDEEQIAKRPLTHREKYLYEQNIKNITLDNYLYLYDLSG